MDSFVAATVLLLILGALLITALFLPEEMMSLEYNSLRDWSR